MGQAAHVFVSADTRHVGCDISHLFIKYIVNICKSASNNKKAVLIRVNVKPWEQDAGYSTLPSKEYGNGARFRTLRSAYITNFIQIHVILQLSKVFDKSALFMQNKANLQRVKMSTSIYGQKDCENVQRQLL